MATLEKLEDDEKAVLTFIVEHIKAYGWGPSLQEIAAGVGFAAKSTAFIKVRNLSEKGYIVKGENPRQIRVEEPA